ncbi:phospholipase D-like domain-containing protein [Trichocoleus desertorum AS-A10]|uniref:phospholipase D-like domain-containing protein n=1 Tax=Trichocoleus desertorum TaxID=1481672 RepID=UPI0032994931
MSNRHWLETAEYTSLAASAIGSIAATVSQQVVFAAAPISVSLALGTLNRNRLQQAQQTSQVAITQVDQQFRGQIESVQQQLKTLPPPPEPFDPSDLQAQIAKTQTAIATLQQDAEATVTEVRQYLDSKLEGLQAQLQTELSQIPPVFNPQYLEVTLAQVDSAITELSKGLAAVQACLVPLQAIDLNPLHQQVSQLQKSLEAQAEGSETRSASLQTQLNQLSQQIEQLERVNRTAVQPHISELAAKLKPTVEATAILTKQLAALIHQVGTKAEHQKVAELRDAILQLQQQLDQLPPPPQPFDPTPLQVDIKGLRSQANDLQQQVQEVRLSVTDLGKDERLEQVRNAITTLEQKSQEFLTNQELAPWQQTVVDRVDHGVTSLKIELEMLNRAFTERREQSLAQQSEELQQQIQDLEAWLKSLDTSFEVLHDRTRNLDVMQQQLEQLIRGAGKVNELETTLAELSQGLAEQVDEVVDKRIVGINQLLQQMQPSHEYKLIYDRHQSREILFKAVKQAQERLILVCPWLYKGIQWNERELVDYFKTFLSVPNSQIEIGWGHWQDINSDKVRRSSGLLRERLKAYSDMYSALEDLEDLERQYPKQFKLKLLGTHEKFLVCDRQFAMLGSHNFLSSSDYARREREVGLYTTDPRIINELVKRFESAKDLEQQKTWKITA